MRRIRSSWSRLDHAQRFSVVALVCVFGCAVVFGWLLKTTVYDIAQRVENDLTGMVVRQQMDAQLSPELFRSGDPIRDEALGNRILEALALDEVFRVKLYGSDGQIIWSDEPRLLGRRFPDNEFLNRALRGEITSVIETPHRTEHVFERGLHDEIVETYVPISEDGSIVGVVEVYRYPERLFALTQRSTWLLWSASLGGGVLLYLAMVGVVRRINTHQRRLEKDLRRSSDDLAAEKLKLERIINAMGAGLVLAKSDGRIQWANQRALSWFAGPDDLVGANLFRGVCRTDEPCSGCPIAFTSGRKYPVHCERRLPSRSGRERVFHVITTMQPPAAQDDGAEHFLQLILDVTERKEIDAQLQQASKLSLIGQLAGGLAHQINNPVGILLTTTTHHLVNAKREGRSAELTEDLEMMERQCRRIDHAVRSLLSFSRPSQELHVPVDLQKLLDEAILLTRPRLKQSGVHVEKLLAGQRWTTLGDPNELLQVLLNLLNNAIDAMPEGGRLRIELRSVLASPANGDGASSLHLQVADTGYGIRDEQLDQIFEPFFTTKEIGSGTGLGLAVTRRIVESVGGTIRASSAAGGGAVFDVQLPPA